MAAMLAKSNSTHTFEACSRIFVKTVDTIAETILTGLVSSLIGFYVEIEMLSYSVISRTGFEPNLRHSQRSA
jgi:hypothetical protein